MGNRKNKKDNNFLDFIPVREEKYKWEKDEAGAVTIFVENKGVFNRFAGSFRGDGKFYLAFNRRRRNRL